jgi:hypothetical protein
VSVDCRWITVMPIKSCPLLAHLRNRIVTHDYKSTIWVVVKCDVLTHHDSSPRYRVVHFLILNHKNWKILSSSKFGRYSEVMDLKTEDWREICRFAPIRRWHSDETRLKRHYLTFSNTFNTYFSAAETFQLAYPRALPSLYPLERYKQWCVEQCRFSSWRFVRQCWLMPAMPHLWHHPRDHHHHPWA